MVNPYRPGRPPTRTRTAIHTHAVQEHTGTHTVQKPPPGYTQTHTTVLARSRGHRGVARAAPAAQALRRPPRRGVRNGVKNVAATLAARRPARPADRAGPGIAGVQVRALLLHHGRVPLTGAGGLVVVGVVRAAHAASLAARGVLHQERVSCAHAAPSERVALGVAQPGLDRAARGHPRLRRGKGELARGKANRSYCEWRAADPACAVRRGAAVRRQEAGHAEGAGRR